MKETNNIQKTAATVVDLANNADVKYTREISDLLISQFGELKSFAPSLSTIPASRYLTNHKLLESMVDQEPNIIELGSGFTPHNLNLKSDKYIEVDFEENSKIKEDIVKSIDDTCNTKYVSGSIYEENTWEKIYEMVDNSKPTIIFSEGVLLYGSEEEKDNLCKYCMPLLENGGMFVFDDSLKNHPELNTNEKVIEGRKNIVSKSKNQNYGVSKVLSQEDVENQWKERGFNSIERMPYVTEGIEDTELIDKFKLFICYRGQK